jgi:hypothetical protein
VEVAFLIYVLAVIGAIAIVTLLWRTFDAQGRALTSARRDRAVVPPDDDPDFLRRLDEQQGKPNDDDG